MSEQTTPEEREVGRKLLKEFHGLVHVDMSGAYAEFDSPRKDLWLAFLDRWGRVVHLRSPRVRGKGV